MKKCKCDCCKIIKGCGEGYQSKEFVIELEGGWKLNHYGGKNSYLGWLVLSTKEHRTDFDKLECEEQKWLGKNMKLINNKLPECWKKIDDEDSIERIHFAYLNETPHINRHTFLREESLLEESHVHIHILTRTRKIGEALYYCPEKIGWRLMDYVDEFPKEYRVYCKDDFKVIKLMKCLNNLLSK